MNTKKPVQPTMSPSLVREACDLLGWSLYQLALNAEVDNSYLCKMMRGARPMSNTSGTVTRVRHALCDGLLNQHTAAWWGHRWDVAAQLTRMLNKLLATEPGST